ncbi:MAG: UDP-N-acetylmuramoyl-L-alanine--D-glutamate ligase [Candidatus Saccharimonadales bacterium]
MNIAILGYGAQGQSAHEYWRDGNEITICDRNEALKVPDGARTQLGAAYLSNLNQFDLIVRSPGVHPEEIVKANSPTVLKKVTTVTNEFFQVCPTKNIIGVTGTKGKGTTSTLIAKILEADGRRVHLGGNIGTPPLELLKNDIKADDWVVLELANFQLIDLKYSSHIAVCLMISPEHLDWHADSEAYYEAKTQLFRYQTAADIAIYYADNEISKQIADSSSAEKIPYMTPPGAAVNGDKIMIDDQIICAASELKLLGKHNWQNVCAAVTAIWQVTQNIAAIRSVLTTFSGLEHRLELVRELDGTRYYDDSFGTTPETAIVALQAFAEPKVIILGGSDKGADYTELARTVAKSNVREALLIGEQAERIKEALMQVSFTNTMPGGTTMTEIVTTAREQAQSGDVILLSPACASFDMFKNYKDRGEQFKIAVQALAKSSEV